DVEEFRLPPSLYGEIRSRQLPPRPADGAPFIRGPIPFAGVALASRLPGSCLIVAIATRFLRSRYPRKAGWSVAEIGWRVGLVRFPRRYSAILINWVSSPGIRDGGDRRESLFIRPPPARAGRL